LRCNLFRGDKYTWSLQLTAVNITDKVAPRSEEEEKEWSRNSPRVKALGSLWQSALQWLERFYCFYSISFTLIDWFAPNDIGALC